MTWKKLVKVANKAESKIRIYNLKDLDQSCFCNMRPVKITFNKECKLIEKTKTNTTTFVQIIGESTSKKTRLEKWKYWKRKKIKPKTALEMEFNINTLIKKYIRHITCYSFNKKEYHTRDYPDAKNQ